jgi:hypothetical protein
MAVVDALLEKRLPGFLFFPDDAVSPPQFND